FQESSQSLIVSVSPNNFVAYGDIVQTLRQVKLTPLTGLKCVGHHVLFGPAANIVLMTRGIESMLVAVPSSGPPITRGFTANQLFVPTGNPYNTNANRIAKL